MNKSYLIITIFLLTISFVYNPLNCLAEDNAKQPKSWGIAPGIMYVNCTGSSKYISSAYMNSTGNIFIRDDLSNITRTFPTFTGFVEPFYKNTRDNWYNDMIFPRKSGHFVKLIF